MVGLSVAHRTHSQVLSDTSSMPASFKLELPIAEVRGAQVDHRTWRTTEAFIGQCPTIKAKIEVELQGLLDMGSQVTLMQQSLFEDNFSQTKLGKAPFGL